MASEPSDGPDGPQKREVATQDAYESATAETTWYDLEHGPGSYQVRRVKPLKLLRNAEDAGILGMLSEGDVDEEQLKAAMMGGGFGDFMQSTIVPNVIQPQVYWDEDAVDDPDNAFDLTELEPEDLFGLISAMTGSDQADLADKAEELQGNQ